MNKELRKLIETLRGLGFDVRETSKQHHVVRTADGEFVTTLAGTTSDHRSIKNAKAAIKRAQRAMAEAEKELKEDD